MVTGFAFFSRLTQIAPPSTRFVFLGAGIRLGLPSHPASRRRSCLRLGVTSSRTIGLGASWPGELARGIQQAVGPAGTSAVLGLRRVGRWALRSETSAPIAA